jgi:hypothetical protein
VTLPLATVLESSPPTVYATARAVSGGCWAVVVANAGAAPTPGNATIRVGLPMGTNRTAAPAWSAVAPFELNRPVAVSVAAESAGGGGRVISDCHCSVQLNHVIPGFLSHSVAVF